MNHGLDPSQSALAQVTKMDNPSEILEYHISYDHLLWLLDEPVVDGEGQIVSGGGEGVLAPSSHGGGEVPGGLGSASGDLGEHLLSWEFV